MIRFATFSRTNARGRTSAIRRRYSNMRFPRGSLRAARPPPVQNDWHGGPPTIKSTSRAPPASRRASAVSALTSPRITRRAQRLVVRVAQDVESISTASRGFRPTLSKPRSRPPAPEKKDQMRATSSWSATLTPRASWRAVQAAITCQTIPTGQPERRLLKPPSRNPSWPVTALQVLRCRSLRPLPFVVAREYEVTGKM